MIDVHEATIAIELPAVATLASHRTEEHLRVLSELLDDEEARFGVNGSDAVLAASALHRTIVDLAGNETLAIMHGMLEEVIIGASREIANTLQSGFVSEAIRFHRVHEESFSSSENARLTVRRLYGAVISRPRSECFKGSRLPGQVSRLADSFWTLRRRCGTAGQPVSQFPRRLSATSAVRKSRPGTQPTSSRSGQWGFLMEL